MKLVRKHSNGEVVVEFVRNKAIERQFHSYFSWGARNANQFFRLFGEGYKSYMAQRVKADQSYDQAVRAFLEIGDARNRLVHQDFGNFTLEKTSEEIFALYEEASRFVRSIESSFDEYLLASRTKEPGAAP